MSTPPPSKAGPAWIPASTRDWPTYFDRVAGGEPRSTLTQALDAFDAEPSSEIRFAIDLGCGEGRDTAELLRRGWRVLAIDGHPDGIRRLVSREDLVHTDRLTMQMRLFEGMTELPQADLISASFSLPFCPPECFDTLWAGIRAAIKPGGRFAGQIFGDRDSWASIPDRSHFTRAQADSLFDGLKLEHFDEEEREGSDASDNHKHWHMFHIVAHRPA